MADEFCFSLLHTSTLQILQAAGFETGQAHSTHVLTNVFEQYIKLLSTTASAYSRLSTRTTGTIYDVLDTFEELAIDLSTFKTWLDEEVKSLSPSWTEQGDPSRILEGIVHNGLNRQQDSMLYKYMDYPGDEEEGSQLSEEEQDEVEEMEENNKENKLPEYVPSYFPAFPVIVTAEDTEEHAVVIEPKIPLPAPAAAATAAAGDALPLPNIVKKKKRPIDNPFTYLKSLEDSICFTEEKDQPAALSLSAAAVNRIETPTYDNIPRRRRRSELLSGFITDIDNQDNEPRRSKMIKEDVSLSGQVTRDLAAPGNTMFANEKGLLDKLMTDLSDPLAIPKLMTPNLLMDIVPPPTGSITPSSTLRLNMASSKTSMGGMTIDKIPKARSVTTPTAEEEIVPQPSQPTETTITPTTIKLAPVSLASLSSSSPTTKTEEKRKKVKAPKEKKPKSSKKREKKVTLPAINTTISHDEPTPPSLSAQPILESPSNTTATPKIRIKFKLPTPSTEEQTPAASVVAPAAPATEEISTTATLPEETSATDIINCICEFPTEDYGHFMIACDTCRVWYHGQCVGIAESDQVEEWHCSRCRPPV